MTLRGNSVQAELADRQNPEDTVVCDLDRIVPVRVLGFFGNFRFDPEDSVPQPAVVSTDIADGVQGRKPGTQDHIMYAKRSGDLFLDVGMRSVIESEHTAKGHDLTGDPNRHVPVAIPVLIAEMLDKNFLTVGGLILDISKKSGPFNRGKLRQEYWIVRIAEWTAGRVGMMVSQSRAYRDLNSLNCVHDQ